MTSDVPTLILATTVAGVTGALRILFVHPQDYPLEGHPGVGSRDGTARG